MVDEVKVKADYTKRAHVPVIGQKKRMRVNGALQTMTLNHLAVERRGTYDDDCKFGFYYRTEETWGDHKDVLGY